jgi:2-succinyl-5-enolpyruvyl-6-hydroxy-3-cyclohexene-1-carboxylate synthase
MSVATASRQAAFCVTLVDELVAGGLGHAVICPGSRSTPLALALAGAELRCHVRLDERSAGFFAVGLARATGEPVAVLVTSGTAAAELHAAVAEAQLEQLPLVVITADRPPELHGIGAPQTIEQRGIFASHVRYALDPGPVHALPPGDWRPLVSRLVLEARGLGGVSGPVHLNLALIEPLLAEPAEIPERRSGGGAWFEAASARCTAELVARDASRGIIVAGRGAGDPRVLVGAASRLGWPLVADPRSGCRVTEPVVVAGADSFLRDATVAAALAPEVIVLAGAPPASKVLDSFLRAAADGGAEVMVVGPAGASQHPTMRAATIAVSDPADALASLAERQVPAAGGWLDAWRRVEVATQEALDEQLARGPMCEPAVARLVSAHCAEPVALVCSSSMPIRDLEWFGRSLPAPGPVHANRGANGIDGVLSTAMGVAAARRGPVACLIGDLAFLHDVSALVDAPGAETSLTVVVVDNCGGGIFSFLPQRAGVAPDRFEQLFGTPPTVEVARVAAGFGVEVLEVSSVAGLDQALTGSLGSPGMRVLVVDVPDRDTNVELHAALVARVGEVARSALG